MTKLNMTTSVIAPLATVRSSGIESHQPRAAFAGVRRIFRFVVWILSGFGLLTYFRHRTGRSREEIVVYTVHQSFYLWAIILVGYIAAACVNHWPGSAHAWGWIYIFALLYTIVTLLFDVNTKKALLWGGIFLLLWIASKYLEDMKHLTILSGVWRYLAALQPSLDPGTASVISWMLLMPWIGALFHSFSRGRKAFSPNSIEERFMGEGREIIDRSGLKFRTRYRDLFETFLGLGAGDLEAVDGNQHVVKRWDSILFLCFAWPRLDEILHQPSAVVDNAPENPVEAEDVRRA
ncbi:MAG: hypothetical protein H7Z14_08680 [Anaerolineae bacterium]|nr:hypothetical protein [Phycisphaerae bacterium]